MKISHLKLICAYYCKATENFKNILQDSKLTHWQMKTTMRRVEKQGVSFYYSQHQTTQ